MSDHLAAVQAAVTRQFDAGLVESAVFQLLEGVGEEPHRDGLRDTPKRVARALRERLSGYEQSPAEILGRDFESDGYDQMVTLLDVPFYSLCEHHMENFSGTATVAYIPSERVVGLSKLARLVQCFARRLQIQERMTQQIADALRDNLHPRGWGVLIRARHLCMQARGARLETGPMVTTAVGGIIKDDPKARDEFLRVAGV